MSGDMSDRRDMSGDMSDKRDMSGDMSFKRDMSGDMSCRRDRPAKHSFLTRPLIFIRGSCQVISKIVTKIRHPLHFPIDIIIYILPTFLPRLLIRARNSDMIYTHRYSDKKENSAVCALSRSTGERPTNKTLIDPGRADLQLSNERLARPLR